MTKEDPNYNKILDIIEDLIDSDPEVDSPLGRLLDGLSQAIMIYEKEVYGEGTYKVGEHGQSLSAKAPDIIKRSIRDNEAS